MKLSPLTVNNIEVRERFFKDCLSIQNRLVALTLRNKQLVEKLAVLRFRNSCITDRIESLKCYPALSLTFNKHDK
jgi:hypothetical protein